MKLISTAGFFKNLTQDMLYYPCVFDYEPFTGLVCSVHILTHLQIYLLPFWLHSLIHASTFASVNLSSHLCPIKSHLPFKVQLTCVSSKEAFSCQVQWSFLWPLVTVLSSVTSVLYCFLLCGYIVIYRERLQHPFWGECIK